MQPNQRTIQSEIENALKIVCRTECKLTGSGRTDTGVHAAGQVAHFDLVGELDLVRVLRSLNGILDEDIAVLDLKRVPNNFHARYDAVERHYGYYLSTVKTALHAKTTAFVTHLVDIHSIQQAADILVRKADFSSFCKTQSATTNRVCDIRRATWTVLPDGRQKFAIVGDRFLHGMVRAIVGTLLQVGSGSRKPFELSQILDSRDRRAAGPAAPPHGLSLEKVVYPADFE